MPKTMGATSIVLAMSAATAVHAEPISFNTALLPQNGSGVSGSAQFTLDVKLLTMQLTASGLTPNQVHKDHLHGLLGAAAPNTTLPSPSADTNHDGYIERGEAAPFSGPPLFATPASVSPLVYPTASAAGTISYTQTYDITNTALYDPDHMGLTLTPADILGLTGGNTVPLVDRIFELHGEIVPAGIDGTPDQGNGFGYDPDMPVAAAKLVLGSSSIPEPWSFVLFGTGLLGFFAVRRRRAA
jgi:PEP-CTERM motif